MNDTDYELATQIDQLALEQKAEELPRLLRELEAAFAQVKPRLEKERDALNA